MQNNQIDNRNLKYITFGSPLIGEDEILEVVNCLKSGWIGTGPITSKFEDNFAEYKGVKKAIAVNSCTAALHLGILSLNLSEGDEVITTPLTFCATVNSIIHAGATPVLADIDLKTMNIDPLEIEKKITPKTKAILPVHFAGRPCEMSAIMAIAKKFNLKVIEDCAHAIETEYQGMKAGTIGDVGCFSFYVTKNITTGEGGMLISKDANALSRIKNLSLHGMDKDAWKRFGSDGYKHYRVTEVGFKYNMTDTQASLGIHQLAKINDFWIRRKNIWNKYMQELSDLPIQLPAPSAAGTKHGYHLFTILIDQSTSPISRDNFIEEMNIRKIGVGVHYMAVSEHPIYKKLFLWNPLDYPNATKVSNSTVSIPLSAGLSDEDVDRIIRNIKEIFLN